MHSQGNLAAYTNGKDPIPYYMGAIEAMDFQIGRLLDNIPESEKDNTVIIFIGDNGTPNQVAQSPVFTMFEHEIQIALVHKRFNQFDNERIIKNIQ